MNKKYVPNEKNGGIVPECIDKRVLHVDVGCGRCIECMKKRARGWQVRLHEEMKLHDNALFVTFTFSDESIDDLSLNVPDDDVNSWYNEICRKAIRYFLERWRKKHKKSVRHWFITERGGRNSERIHVHGIVFSDNREEVIRCWGYGHVYIGSYVDGSTINYIVKYMFKQDGEHKEFYPKVFSSPGIGKNYIGSFNYRKNVFDGDDTKDYYLMKDGSKIALPTYYRNNIYSDDERELLFRRSLDSNVIYVMGEKVDVSGDLEDYFGLLDYYDKVNKRLGYGSDVRNYNEKRFKSKMLKSRLNK